MHRPSVRHAAISLATTAVVVAGVVYPSHFGTHAQSKPAAAAPATEWPTYGHDQGGARFSPLAQITPANVSRLQIAWVYHMKPAGAGPTAPVPVEPEAPAPPGRGGRPFGGGSGFAASETTPLIVGGIMYIASPYGRVVALNPTTGKELWVFQLPSSSPATRGVEYWPGDAIRTPRIVFGSADGKLYSLDAESGKARPGLRRTRRRESQHRRNSPGLARQRWPELAAHRLQEPDHHRRPHAGRARAGAGRRRPRVGCPHGQAGVDVPLGAAPGRALSRDLGRRQLEESDRRQRLGPDDRGRRARHRVHAVRRAGQRSLRRRSARRQPLQHERRRGGCRHRQIPLALPGRPPRHLGW